jgi:hypothetical protein
MSIASQAHVNVLRGTLGSAYVNGRPGGDNELITSIPDNALENPTFDVEETPPFGNSYAGVVYFGKWAHFGQLYTNSVDDQTSTQNFYLANFPAFKDLGGGTLGDQRKVLALYGTGTNFPSNTGVRANTNNNRTFPQIPLVGFHNGSGTAGSFPDDEAWVRHEWCQGVAIPDSATTVNFGAYVRVPNDDMFRSKNCGGFYIWQTKSGTNYINSLVIRKEADDNTFELDTGAATGLAAIQQWSGISNTIDGGSGEYPLRYNDSVSIQNITYRDAEDFPQFTKVELSVSLQSGTNRRLGLGLFFGENQDNLDESGTPSGLIQFYNPFILFS